MSHHRISRRDALKTISLGTAGAILAACGRGTEGGAEGTGSGSATNAPAGGGTAPATISSRAVGSYKGKFVIVSVGNPDQNKPLIDAIRKAHQGVQVEWRNFPSERFAELFTAAEVAGDQIDLMDLNGQDLRRYAVGDKLRDLSNIPYLDRFREVATRTYTIHGKLWALPRGGISGFPFHYNKMALQKVGMTKEPETYQELLDIAPDLKKAGIAPFVHPGKNIYLWPVWQFWAHAQTSGNKAVENTAKTLAGDMKFTDPEHVQALEILHRFAQDGMFINSVNSLDSDAAWRQFSQGKAAFFYDHSYRISTFREGKFPNLDMSLMPPVRAVEDANVKRQLPGGTGSALCMYAKIAPERVEVAESIMDLMTSDKWVKWANELAKDPASCNKNVQASHDPLALKYAKECSPNQITYLDWNWPPEITRAFQENQQALVAGSKQPADAAQSIQGVLEDLYDDGYQFEA
jgi:raffinose/stachyose/melibiose transport system substrate-binding protein